MLTLDATFALPDDCTTSARTHPGRAAFEILVDGQRAGEEEVIRGSPERFFDVEYASRRIWSRVKEKVTVRFQATQGNRIGPELGIRAIPAGGER